MRISQIRQATHPHAGMITREPLWHQSAGAYWIATKWCWLFLCSALNQVTQTLSVKVPFTVNRSLYGHAFVVSGDHVAVNVLCGNSGIQIQPCPECSFLSATISHLPFSVHSKHLCFFKRTEEHTEAEGSRVMHNNHTQREPAAPVADAR